MKSPAKYPYYAYNSLSARPSDNSTYMEFAKATFAITDKSALVALAQKYFDDCKAKYAQIVDQDVKNQAELAYLKDMLIPAASEAINNIARSGNFTSINDANKFKDSAAKNRDYAIADQKANKAVVDVATIAIAALQDSFGNISDSSTVISSAEKGQSANYWARIVYLWQFDFNSWSDQFSANSQKEIDHITAASADIGKIFDIDDAANGDKSYRATHKIASSKASLDEKDKQEQVAKSEEFYSYLGDQAKQSPIGYYLSKCIKHLVDSGIIYTTCPVSKPVFVTPPATAFGYAAKLAYEISKFARDTFVWDLCNGVFANKDNLTENDISVIMAVNGGAFTRDELTNAIKNKSPQIYLPPASISASLSRLKNINLSALSSSTRDATGGQSQIDARAEAARRAREEAAARLAAEKAAKEEAEKRAAQAQTESEKKALQDQIAQLQAQIEKSKQDAIAAEVAVKEAEEKKKAEENLDKNKDVALTELPVKSEDKQQKLIFGYPAPYVIGGGVAVLAVLLIASRK